MEKTMIELEDFRNELIQNARITSQQIGNGDCAAFVDEVIKYYQDMGFYQDYQSSFFSKRIKGNAEVRFDGYSYEEAENCLTIVTAIYSGDDIIPVVTQTDIQNCFVRALRFVQNSLGENKLEFKKENLEVGHQAYDLFKDLNQYTKDNLLQNIKLLFITDGKISERIKTINVESINNIPVSFEIIDITELYKTIILSGENEEISIDLSEYQSSKNGLQCIEIPQNTNLFKCYLAVFPGDALAELYHRYGSKLLEGNVRSFLTTKKAVNKKIRATILQNPSLFFVYNNGIAVTSTKIETTQTPEGLKITKINNLQIINGGQTTASLASAKFKDKASLSQIAVQVKLTVINTDNKDQNGKLIQEISRSSNSQNPVSNADFFSNHPFQQQIKLLSESTECEAPAINNSVYRTCWFYERTNGEYNQKKMFKTQAEVRRFEERNPKNQKITKTSLAKSYNLYINQFPHLVSKGSMTNFCKFADEVTKSWDDPQTGETYKKKFHFGFYRQMASIHLLIEKTGDIVSSQPWYDGSYRANIVAYSIAFFFFVINRQFYDKGKKFNYHTIWDKQEIPDDLVQIMTDITSFINNYILEDAMQKNVTQWCKTERCWKALKEKDYTLPDYSVSLLEDLSEYDNEDKMEKKNLEEVLEITSMNDVLKFSETDWINLENYHFSDNFTFTYPEISSIREVRKMAGGKGRNANKKTCKIAIAAIDKAYNDGFKLSKINEI